MCMAWEEAAREAGATDRDIEILNQMRLARGKKPVVVPTIREYFLGWLEANKPPQLSPSTHTRYTSSIRKFLSFLGGECAFLSASRFHRCAAPKRGQGETVKGGVL